ncbi:ketopantoate reductase PanE/ApbA C terminal-domain-containing protein [Neohortaea acidophila]|uniref:Ketopantoate reductase PanE/ApbA C terminal-domain-containing protein n=1 Tax=Neohortaea acidophila TaxID=245834 RepID=A0A6A6PGS6_9PEZI|nr:ketopantoate reductase PanE/ApbA C terminal-domain-containing protein [Neohortaea acidophila]KAF2478497.1 ketopantoate reductase PanE/ApbA C terminal-domain-containing protein [Neohortaea acidophila]
MSASQHSEVGPCTFQNQDDRTDLALSAAGRLCDLISEGGASATLHFDTQPRRWSKLLINAPCNPICALTRLDDARFLNSSSFAVTYVQRVMHQVVDIAQESGYMVVTHATAEERLKQITDRSSSMGYEPSMSADVQRRRPLDIEAILGNAIRIAQTLGVTTTNSEAL